LVRTDVLIVGAGPSGLVLANVLAAHGVDFRIVDSKSGPVAESRAAIVHVRTLELLERIGLAERAVTRGMPTTRIEICERGRRTAVLSLAGTKAHSPFPYALALEQDRTEHLLVEGLGEHSRKVDWETELVALTDGATAVLRGPCGEETVTARWVVGADGARSRVRHAVGLRGGFVGMMRLSNGRWRLFGAVPRDFAPRENGDDISHEAYAQVSLDDIQQWFDTYFRVAASLNQVAWSAL
jgi:2-polyprenyl-6-methoxyphenol hydroxylase-like FAD-dependent oxidoreductase